MNIINRIIHEIRFRLGLESKVSQFNAGKPHVVTSSSNGTKTVQEGTKPTMTTGYMPTPSANRTIRVKLAKGFKAFRVSLFPIIVLLVVRELVPSVAEQLEPVYAFLDTVVVPVINWLYTFALKVAESFMSSQFGTKIVKLFASLAI